MLARLLQFVVLGILAFAFGWHWLFFSSSAWLAWAGLWSVPVAYSGALGLGFAFASRVNRSDSTPSASLRQWFLAWSRELAISLKVFAWWQPFRSQALPDQWFPGEPGQRGVILIHGFACNRGVWTRWLAALHAQGCACVAIDLEPVFGSIDDYAPQIDAAVARMTTATGRLPVLVCHSMGGLAARAWLRAAGPGADERVSRIITLGTPHHGTWMGRFSRSANGLQMHYAGRWTRQLVADEPVSRAARFTCWYSNCDNIVFPASAAMLAGAENRFAPGLAHVQLAVDPGVMQACLDEIRVI
jgi:triacylglycerol lipase